MIPAWMLHSDTSIWYHTTLTKAAGEVGPDFHALDCPLARGQKRYPEMGQNIRLTVPGARQREGTLDDQLVGYSLPSLAVFHWSMHTQNPNLSSSCDMLNCPAIRMVKSLRIRRTADRLPL
jgi:hypothetical protein